MTRPAVDERGPAPDQPWQPTSSEWRRRDALEATRQAVAKAKDGRKKPKEETP